MTKPSSVTENGRAGADPASEDAFTTAAQRARRTRILSAAAELATEGGFDAVQMREVAERADVALGTLYRYFPSKIHLLVSVLADEMDQLQERLAASPPAHDEPAERVVAVLQRFIRAMERNPRLYGAVVRALMFGDETTTAENNAVSEHMDAIVTRAMATDGEAATTDDAVTARLISKIWLADILSWLAGRTSAEQMQADVAVAVRRLIPGR